MLAVGGEIEPRAIGGEGLGVVIRRVKSQPRRRAAVGADEEDVELTEPIRSEDQLRTVRRPDRR